MELRHLRYFEAVVQSGSLTAAAQSLHMSQPPLSVAMAQLEGEVGVRLLVRSARGVEPTSAGRYLLEAASRIVGAVDEATATLQRFGAGTAGSLRVAAVPTLMWHRIPRLLAAHAASAPEVDVHLLDPPPWTAIDLLRRGQVDLAAVMVADPRRFARRHRGSLDIVDWGPVPIVAALPPGEASGEGPVPLAMFDGRDLVLPQRTSAVPSLPEAVDAALRAHGVAPGTVRVAETIQTCIPLIEAGLACGLLPDPDRSSLSRFRVTVRSVRPAPGTLEALVLTRHGAGRDPALARLLEEAARLSLDRV